MTGLSELYSRRGLLAGCLLLSFIGASCSRTPPLGPKLDPALATLIPQDTTLLAGFRLDLAQRTPVYQKYFANRPMPFVGQLAERTKIDPKKDLWELLLISDGKQSAVLARGKFADESEPRIEQKGDQRFGYKGFNLVGNEERAYLLLAPTTLGVGDTPMLRRIVDARAESHGPPSALAEKMKEVSPEAQFWSVFLGSPLRDAPLPGNLGNLSKLFGLLQSGSAYLDLSMGLNGVATGHTATEQDAQQVQTAVKGFIGLGRLSTPPDRPELQRLWDSLRVTQEGTQTKLYADIPEELVEKTLELVPGMQPQPPR